MASRTVVLRVASLMALAAGPAAPLPAQVFAEAGKGQVDYTRPVRDPVTSCAQVGRQRAKDVVALTARSVAAERNVPAHCRLNGTIAPEVAFEVSLPARWNGRFYMIGNGGHAGESLDDPGRAAQRNRALELGFAFAQTNTGHDARKEPGGTFVLSNPQKAVDYAYRAVHVTATTAKDYVARYYGQKPQRAYWNSCSNGGRQGLIEAQRYPEDFDGIVANAPWVDQTGFTIGAVWNQQALEAAPLTIGKLNLLAKSVMAKCDTVDGLEDGLIDDPRRCAFDAHRDVPACAAGSDADSCLTSAQADTVMKIYSGPQANGRRVFPGFMLGSEAPAATPNSTWSGFIVPAQPGARSADYNLAENTMRYLVHVPPKPDYDTRTFDFARDPPMLDAWGRQANAKSVELGPFRDRGGKVLMTYGWADQILQPLMGVQYYESVAVRHGARTSDFFRLFMVPGMTHCAGGLGPDQFDSMSAIIDWVEGGKAPDVLRAAKIVDGKTVRTRPLCPYPQVARHTGQGSIDDAANFRCETPRN